jgi:hypothetical protein
MMRNGSLARYQNCAASSWKIQISQRIHSIFSMKDLIIGANKLKEHQILRTEPSNPSSKKTKGTKCFNPTCFNPTCSIAGHLEEMQGEKLQD